jgi:hypothetical protein
MPALKWLGVALGLLSAFLLGVWVWNFLTVSSPVRAELSLDSRNGEGALVAHYSGYVDPNNLVLDLRADEASVTCADMSRMLFAAAQALTNIQFHRIFLLRHGQPKFLLDGKFFNDLGVEYRLGQNPIYLMRTLPQNVLNKDGGPAFSTWTGGMLGVLGQQMNDLNRFCDAWISA